MPAPRAVATQLLDLVLPSRCAGCAAFGPALCLQCAEAALGLVTDFGGPRRVVPDPLPAGFPVTVAIGPYAGVLATALSAYKDDDRVDLADALGGLLAVAVDALIGPGQPALLVPIPSSRASVRRRGRDSLVHLCVAAARSRQAPTTVAAILGSARTVRDQAGLTAAQRWRNLDGAFVVRSRADLDAHGALVLVDDVVTTGATLVSGTAALAAAALRPAGAAVICATRRHRWTLAKTAPLG